MHLLEILFGFFGVASVHGVVSFLFPGGGAHFSVYIGVLISGH